MHPSDAAGQGRTGPVDHWGAAAVLPPPSKSKDAGWAKKTASWEATKAAADVADAEDAADIKENREPAAADGGGKPSTGVAEPRPFGEAEAGILAVQDQAIYLCAPTAGLREFRADKCLPAGTSQHNAYVASAAPLLCDWLNGVNGCLFVFGQTGSGKTFTMFGPDEESSVKLTGKLNPDRGLVPRIMTDAIGHVGAVRGRGGRAQLDMAVVEVHGNDVSDLLHGGVAVGAWQGVAARAVLSGGGSCRVHDAAAAEELLGRAESAKRKAATAMNERSSRAHTVIVLVLTQHKRGGQVVRSQLCLADLGGSEQLKKSKAEGERRDEAIKINQGLLALKQCIEALNRKSTHVPYHASTLTALLEGALTGTSRTAVVVTGSMDPRDTLETMHALRFGELCGATSAQARLSVNTSAAAIKALNRQIEALEGLIQKKERWETRKVQREDMDGVETVMHSTLVGAETERAEMEALLRTRDGLVGV